MRRAYSEVRVATVGTGFGVTLDDKALKTPAGTPIVVPTRALAAAIAEEWSNQGERLRFDALPLTRIASTALAGDALWHAPVVRRELAVWPSGVT